MPEIGAAALVVAFGSAIFVALAALAGTRGDDRWVEASRRGVYAMAALLVIAVVALEVSFARSDFSLELVANHSSTTTPAFYKLTAMWGSQGGSLLLWAFVLSIAASAVLFATRRAHREIVPWATAVMAGVAAFFTGLMVAGIFVPGAESWPFARLNPAPAEGAGLNPLLRHPAMAIHPPMLYSGYVFFTVPFAFAIGALVTRRIDASWIRSTRRFALIAWAFLSVGIILGARWSYSELGWGGYWAWDPVENASLMPWLVGTAFLHSVMVQERRGMLRVWNVSLIVATFALALLGTFLVRSGVLQSIHAFGESKVGPALLVLIAVVILGSTALIVSRLPILRSERRVDSLLSRESVFLLNNLLLVGMAGVVFWGTFFPLISEAITGETSSLAAPWFDRYTTPLAIGLVLMSGVGPLLAWRRVSLAGLRRIFTTPVTSAAIALIGLAVVADAASEPWALAVFTVAAFALAGLAGEFIRGARARQTTSGVPFLAGLGMAVGRNRRRYGGYIVHLGVLVLLAGVAASTSFQTSEDLRLRPGESATVGDREVTYVRATQAVDPEESKLTLGAVLRVARPGGQATILNPSRNYYASRSADPAQPVRSFFEGEATSEVGRREGVTEDLWTAVQPDLAALDPTITELDRRVAALTERVGVMDESGQTVVATAQGQAIRAIAERYVEMGAAADIRVNLNPFAVWIWVGGITGLLGAALALWPAAATQRRRVTAASAARLARELGEVG